MNVYITPVYVGISHIVKCDICTHSFTCTCIDTEGCVTICHKCEDELFMEKEYGT